MYFFTHLLAGILIGAFLYLLTRDLIVIVACAVGSILPDLIDKPLGILLSDGLFSYTRIYAHTLVFCLLILIIGVILAIRYKSYLILAAGIGILSHHALDIMWREPWNWLWPVFGPFRGEIYTEYFYSRLFAELTNPYEWLFGFAVIALISILLWIGVRKRSGTE